MREEYSIPEMEIIGFDMEDIIKTSDGDWVDDPTNLEGETDGWQ